MKKKNYVYRLGVTQRDYATLEAAVQDAYADIRQNVMKKDRISSPYVVKKDGGYKVVAFRNDGHVLQRSIDVYVPAAQPQNKAKVKIHNVRTNKAGQWESSNWWWDDEADDECDFDCDNCPDEECEDRAIEDENEGD